MTSRHRRAPPSAVRLWVIRHWRLLVPHRNSLARRWDRAEAVVLAVAIGLFVVAVPIGVSVGSTVDNHALSVAHQQLAHRHQSTAVTRADAPAPDENTAGSVAQNTVQVPATWKAADGGDRSGPLDVAPTTPAGSAVPVWLDTTGNLTTAPMSAADIADLAVGSGILTWAGISTTALIAAWLSRIVLDRRRAAAWASDWEGFARRTSRSE